MKNKIIMYGVFRSPKRKFPDSIEYNAATAKHIVWTWKKEGYSWAKEAYYKRLELTFLPQAAVDVREHIYKIIHK